jgi:iron(III) transport system permease protein
MTTTFPVRPSPEVPRLPDGTRPGRLRRARDAVLTPRTAIVGICAVIVGYLAIVPLYYLLWGTFFDEHGFTLKGFGEAFGRSSLAGPMLVNSIEFALGSAVFALVLGAALAWVQVRTDAPLKALFFAASLVPLIIPAMLYSIAWIFLADPHTGVINRAFGTQVLNVFSMPGMIWVQGLHLSPIAFLLMVAAFRAMDPSLEEAALMSGASRRATLRRVTAPLLRPAIIASVVLVFVQSMESFEVPAIIGLQAKIYVFTSRIYNVLQIYPIDYREAGALAVVLLAIAAFAVLLSSWLSRHASRYQTITGKGFRPRPVALGRARPFVGAAVVIYFLITAVLPVGVLLWASLLPYYQAPSVKAVRSVTLHNYGTVIHMPLALTAFRNSVLLGLAAATAVMFLTAVAAWLIVRTRIPGRRALDVLASAPLVIPGLVMGLALLFVYLRSPLPVYGTLWILLISYATRYLPYGMRYSVTAMAQMNNELEESALVCGATWWQSFRRILVPLMSSGILAGWVYILVVSFRELSSTVLLYSPGKEVLSVLLWEQFNNGNFTVVAAIGVLMVVTLMLLVGIAYRVGLRFGAGTDS